MKPANRSTRRSTTNHHLQLLAAAALALVLSSGCKRLDDYTAAALGDPRQAHPIQFAAETATLYVELPAGGSGLSQDQAADVYRFADRYGVESSSELRISAPHGAGRHIAVARSMRQIEEIVAGAGVPVDAVRTGVYSDQTPYGPAIRLAYRRPVAVPPHCRDWSHDLGHNRERLPYRDFGCATQRNLALTTANARDLQRPQAETPRSSERRSVTWRDYIGDGSGNGATAAGAAAGASGGAGAATTGP